MVVVVVPRPGPLPILALLAFAVLLLAIGILLVIATRTQAPMRVQLSDGSTFALEKVQVTTNSYQYSYQDGPKWLRHIMPWLPPFVRNRFAFGGGSFGMGSDGTNVVVITILRHVSGTRSQAPSRLRLLDDQGNTFDACWGAHTLGMQNVTVNGWQIRAWPRRSARLGLEFLTRKANGDWAPMARFDVANPLFANHPQWIPEALPIIQRDGPLAVTLEEFTAGEPMSAKRSGGDPATMPRKTRVLFAFEEEGKPTQHWRVQKLTLSDATGNRWSPYLDFVKQDFDWTTNGTVEFFGALWPAEQAWKLRCELARISGFQPEQIWRASLPLPAPGTVTTLTNDWQRDGQTISLVAVASPDTDHAGDFKWVAKWWGEDRDKVFSLAIKATPKLQGQRLIVLNDAADSNGQEVKIVQHGSQESSAQALFFKPHAGASTVHFTFAMDHSRFVEFMARPQFADSKR